MRPVLEPGRAIVGTVDRVLDSPNTPSAPSSSDRFWRGMSRGPPETHYADVVSHSSEPTAPNCVNYVRLTNQEFATPFTSYSCGPTPTDILVLKSVTSAGEAIPSASGSTAFGKCILNQICPPTHIVDKGLHFAQCIVPLLNLVCH